MVGCSVLGCGNRSEHKVKGLTFHNFPRNLRQEALWIEATGRINWKPTVYSKICSHHFGPNSIIMKNKIKRLERNAVPQINIAHKIFTRKNNNTTSNPSNSIHTNSSSDASNKIVAPGKMKNESVSNSRRNMRNESGVSILETKSTVINNGIEIKQSLRDASMRIEQEALRTKINANSNNNVSTDKIEENSVFESSGESSNDGGDVSGPEYIDIDLDSPDDDSSDDHHSSNEGSDLDNDRNPNNDQNESSSTSTVYSDFENDEPAVEIEDVQNTSTKNSKVRNVHVQTKGGKYNTDKFKKKIRALMQKVRRRDTTIKRLQDILLKMKKESFKKEKNTINLICVDYKDCKNISLE